MKCPATMCPLFAKDGSPWTGDKDADCLGRACGWHDESRCFAADAAMEQIVQVKVRGAALLVAPSRAPKRELPTAGKVWDCPRAAECKWQAEAKGLCPPREALRLGIDPVNCAW